MCSVLPLLSALVTAFFLPVVQSDEVTSRSLQEEIDGFINEALRRVLPLANELGSSEQLSPECSSSLLQMFMALKRGDAWALRMVLANGFLPNNVLEFGFANLGGYEQCLKTTARTGSQELGFKGQYCTLLVRLPYDFTVKMIGRFHEIGEMKGRANMLTYPEDVRSKMPSFRSGLCIPSVCTQEEVNFIAQYTANMYAANATVKGCRTNDPKTMKSSEVVSMSILGSLATMVVLSTCADLYLRTTRGSGVKKANYGAAARLLLAFSAISNTKRLMTVRSRKGNEPLQFLNGLKFLMCLWVIFGHTYIINQLEYYHSIYKMWEISDQLIFQIINNSFFSVATFFGMSGFALTFLMMTWKKELLEQNLFAVYVLACFRRYIRLVIPALVVVAATVLLPFIVDGPGDWDLFAFQTHKCARNWWTVALGIVNWNPVEDSCMQHLWYISVDIQVFVLVAMPLGLLFLKYPKAAMAVALTLLLGFCALVSYQTYAWKLMYSFTTGTSDVDRIVNTVEQIYFRPFAHVSTYIGGMICGYFSYTYRDITVGTRMRALLWLASVGLSSFMIFVTTPWNRQELPGEVVNALYGGFNRVVWILSMWWLMFSCSTGNGGIVNAFLSMRAFKLTGRLVFGMYLVHYLLLLVRMGLTKTILHSEEFFQLLHFCGFTVLSCFFAYLLNLIVESPVTIIDRMVFEPRDANCKPDLTSETEKDCEKSRL